MPKQMTISVYQFSELSASAKETAKFDHQANGYAFADDSIKSLKKLAAHFGGKLSGYSVDFFGHSRSTADFDMPDANVIGNDNLPDNSDATDWAVQDADVRAAYRKWLKVKLDELGTYNPETFRGTGECKLTGYCVDEDAIDGFRIAWHGGERDLATLMEAGFHSWLKAVQSDCDSQYEDEQFSEHADSNDYLYRENGEIFRG